MCIVKAKFVKAKEVTGYRVYERCGKRMFSPFGLYQKPINGKWTTQLTLYQWSACATLVDANRLGKYLMLQNRMVIYRVRLRGNIMRGRWANSSISEYIADECKILRRVK